MTYTIKILLTILVISYSCLQASDTPKSSSTSRITFLLSSNQIETIGLTGIFSTLLFKTKYPTKIALQQALAPFAALTIGSVIFNNKKIIRQESKLYFPKNRKKINN